MYNGRKEDDSRQKKFAKVEKIFYHFSRNLFLKCRKKKTRKVMSIEIFARNSPLSESVFDRVYQGNRSFFTQRDIVKKQRHNCFV